MAQKGILQGDLNGTGRQVIDHQGAHFENGDGIGAVGRELEEFDLSGPPAKEWPCPRPVCKRGCAVRVRTLI